MTYHGSLAGLREKLRKVIENQFKLRAVGRDGLDAGEAILVAEFERKIKRAVIDQELVGPRVLQHQCEFLFAVATSVIVGRTFAARILQVPAIARELALAAESWLARHPNGLAQDETLALVTVPKRQSAS